MAALANTFQTSAASGNREELSNVINMITPEDTPIYTMIGGGRCSSIHPEWEIQALKAPGENVVAEGDEYTYDASDPVVRVGNYTQIMRKTVVVSRTQDAVDNAGNAEKTARQIVLRGKELRKDVELRIVTNDASKNTDPREFGGLPSWLETNTSRGATGADGGFDQGTGLTVAATDGTQRAFSKALVDDVMQKTYESGGDVSNLVVSPYTRRVFSEFMSDANVSEFRYASKPGQKQTAISTVDVYLSDFGEIMVKSNRVMTTAATARNAYLLDPDTLSFKWLRPIAEDKDIARTGDANKRVLLGEGTLCVENEAANGLIADVFGLTAST